MIFVHVHLDQRQYWKYIKAPMRQSSGPARRSIVERVLTLLTESGLIYFVFIVSSSASFNIPLLRLP
jgi:hypothetical protein